MRHAVTLSCDESPYLSSRRVSRDRDAAAPADQDGAPTRTALAVRLEHLALWAVLALAIALQVNATPTIFGIQIRLSLGDVLCPIAIAFVLADAWHRRRFPRPQWRIRYLGLWLAAMTASLTLALFIGREQIGQWFAWATMSKYAGWFALMAYFLLGGWLAYRFGVGGVQRFLRLCIGTVAAIAALDLSTHLLRLASVLPPARLQTSPLGSNRLEGFMGNPNAFAYLVGIALLLWLSQGRYGTRLQRYGVPAVLIATIALSGSRGLWLALVPVAVAQVWVRGVLSLRPLAVAAPLAALLVLSVVAAPSAGNLMKRLDLAPNALFERLGQALSLDFVVIEQPTAFLGKRMSLRDSDTQRRLENYAAAFEMWLSRPIEGAGLGVFLWTQGPTPLPDGYRPTVHNSLLWILAEMGLIGAVCFLGFFLVCLRAFWPARQGTRDSDEQQIIHAGFLVLVLAAGMSLTTEILYQRLAWMILGAVLVVPSAKSALPRSRSA